jgi:hypothetical protein
MLSKGKRNAHVTSPKDFVGTSTLRDAMCCDETSMSINIMLSQNPSVVKIDILYVDP